MAVRNSEHLTYKMEWTFKRYIYKVIQGHVFWGQWKGDKGLNNIV